MRKREKVMCPICGRRVLDLEWLDITVISLKCPHCRKEIKIERE